MQTKRLKIGEGKISGIVSIFLATLSLLGILCFKFPEWLTTPDLRNVYSKELVENLMFLAIVTSFGFSILSFVLSKQKRYATIGIILCALSIFFGGFEVEGRAVENAQWSLGLDWLLLDLLLMVIIFAPIELVFPKNKEQSKFHPEWRTDLIYFTISHLFIQFFGVITRKPAVLLFGEMDLNGIHQWIQSLPFAVELLLALFISDFFQYWTHRIFHSNVFLWRFHAIHHSTENMDWLAGSRTHFVDIFVTRSMSFIPIYLLGFSSLAFNVFVIILAIHAVFIHANTNLRFGFLKYVITTPQYHHWHHCDDPKFYGKNFAVLFPILDMMFKTYHLPGDVWPKGTGLQDASFPKGYINQTIYPFKFNPFRKELKESDRSHR